MTRLRQHRSRSQKRSEVFDEHDLVARFVVDELVDHLLCEKRDQTTGTETLFFAGFHVGHGIFCSRLLKAACFRLCRSKPSGRDRRRCSSNLVWLRVEEIPRPPDSDEERPPQLDGVVGAVHGRHSQPSRRRQGGLDLQLGKKTLHAVETTQTAQQGTRSSTQWGCTERTSIGRPAGSEERAFCMVMRISSVIGRKASSRTDRRGHHIAASKVSEVWWRGRHR